MPIKYWDFRAITICVFSHILKVYVNFTKCRFFTADKRVAWTLQVYCLFRFKLSMALDRSRQLYNSKTTFFHHSKYITEISIFSSYTLNMYVYLFDNYIKHSCMVENEWNRGWNRAKDPTMVHVIVDIRVINRASTISASIYKFNWPQSEWFVR